MEGDLRVAVDATPLLGARTGVGQFCQELLQALEDRRDLRLSAFAVTWRGRGSLGCHVPPRVRAVNRPMAARPLRHLWKRGSWPPIEWWTGPVDIVHGTNFVVPPSRRAAQVVTVHDLTSVHFPQMCTPASRAYPALIEGAIRRGAWVHTPSAFVAGEVVEHFGVDADRVGVIPHGVPAASHLEEGNAAEGHHLAGCDRYVLALGTIEPRKDLPGLVRAFDLLAADDGQTHLVVAGPDGWGLDAFNRAVAMAHHGDRIRRLGYVGATEKAHLMAGASLFAYPSIYEGFGFPPLEAMTAGLPVVATDAGALPEIVGDGAVVVPTGDHEALAQAMSTALNDGQYRTALVERGRRRAREFSWDRCGQGMAGLYRRAATDTAG